MPGDSERSAPFSEEEMLHFLIAQYPTRAMEEASKLLATIDTLRRDLSEARGLLKEARWTHGEICRGGKNDCDLLARIDAALGREVAP